MPLVPPQINPILGADPMLLARIAALEARVVALEQVINVGPAGVVITSRGDLKISSMRDCVISSEKNLALASKRDFEMKANDASLFESRQTMIKCDSSTISMDNGGTITIKGVQVEMKGSGDVVIKGRKVLQN